MLKNFERFENLLKLKIVKNFERPSFLLENQKLWTISFNVNAVKTKEIASLEKPDILCLTQNYFWTWNLL